MNALDVPSAKIEFTFQQILCTKKAQPAPGRRH